ncbi:MAG: hypothetical protein ACYC10_20230 [Allorhizobium sp.]
MFHLPRGGWLSFNVRAAEFRACGFFIRNRGRHPFYLSTFQLIGFSMSFSKGIHFVAGFSSRVGTFHDGTVVPLSFLHASQSETMTAAGVSSIVGEPPHTRFGPQVLRVVSAEDAFVTTGLDLDSPNAVTVLVLARQPSDFVLGSGSKVSWKPAK